MYESFRPGSQKFVDWIVNARRAALQNMFKGSLASRGQQVPASGTSIGTPPSTTPGMDPAVAQAIWQRFNTPNTNTYVPSNYESGLTPLPSGTPTDTSWFVPPGGANPTFGLPG